MNFLLHKPELYLCLLLTTLFSCSESITESVDPAPSLALATAAESVEAGDTAAISVDIKAAKGLNTVELFIGEATTPLKAVSSFNNKKEYTFNYNYLTSAEQADSELVLRLIATDVNGRSNGISIVKKVTQKEIKLTAYTAKMVSAPNADMSARNWYCTRQDKSFSQSELQEERNIVDFGYYWRSGDEATIAAPTAFNFSLLDLPKEGVVQQATYFKKTATANFDLAHSSSDALKIYNVTAGQQKTEHCKNLQPGDTYSFITADGRAGLLQVKNIQPGYESGNGIELDIKIAPAA